MGSMFKHPLRAFQQEALNCFYGRGTLSVHVICIAPTGSGKSLIYEELAVSRRILLISPLVALARQQAKKCEERGIPVHFKSALPSGGPPRSQSGLWILSPESLHSRKTRESLQRWKPQVLVVDECHCLWEWGQSFRPDFKLIPKLLSTFSIPQSLWLTATLSSRARKNLISLLPMRVIEIGKFSLPKNVHFEIEKVPWSLRLEKLLVWIKAAGSFGIVFVSTREGAERITRVLNAYGMETQAYHAGLSVEERRNVEGMVSEKKISLVVATSAFGMGMDYPHLDFAVLWQAPPTLLSFVQAVGRVGRNGKKARVLVLWDDEDFKLMEWMANASADQQEELLSMRTFLSIKEECRQCYFDLYFNGESLKSKCDSCFNNLPQKTNSVGTMI